MVVYIYASWHQTCVHKASMFAARRPRPRRLLPGAPPACPPHSALSMLGARRQLGQRRRVRSAVAAAAPPPPALQDLAAEYHCDRLSFAMFPIDRWRARARGSLPGGVHASGSRTLERSAGAGAGRAWRRT